MNVKNMFFDLPQEILRCIYEFDGTYKKLFANEESKKSVRYMSQKIKHTSAVKKQFIEISIVSVSSQLGVAGSPEPQWGYISRNPFPYDEDVDFGTYFKVCLYPKEEHHTKYKIIYHSMEPIFDSEFDGFVCNEEQYKLFNNNGNRWFLYEDLWLKLTSVDYENGLYLFAKDTYSFAFDDNIENDDWTYEYFLNHTEYDIENNFDEYDLIWNL